MPTCSAWRKSSARCTICGAICGANEGAKWRNEMQALIDAETPSGERRARMIASFNRGYNGFQQTYRTCTPAANRRDPRYIEEGSKISRDLTARYAQLDTIFFDRAARPICWKRSRSMSAPAAAISLSWLKRSAQPAALVARIRQPLTLPKDVA